VEKDIHPKVGPNEAEALGRKILHYGAVTHGTGPTLFGTLRRSVSSGRKGVNCSHPF
jgi:hypothetical protein